PSKWQSLVAQSGNLSATRVHANEKSLTLKLAKASTFAGRVIDEKTKLPVAGAFVGAAQRTGRMMALPSIGTLTDAKGNFSMQVAPGTYTIAASHPGYDFREPLEVGFASGQQQARELSMPPLARVSGAVSGDDGKPVAAVRLTPEMATTEMFNLGPGVRALRDNIAVSGPDGRFSMRVSGDLDLRLKAAKRGLPEAKSEAFRIAAGERKSGVVVTIPSGIAVSGRVVDKDGKPLSGVAVTAAEAQAGRGGGMMVRSVVMIGGPQQEEDAVRTGSDGAFTLRVKEGTYDFAFKREGYASRTLRGLAISPSQNDPLEATLDPAVEITGRVVRNGSGVEGVMINTFGEGGAGPSTTTGPDGSFTLGGLTPGDVRASVRKEADFISEMRMMTAPGRDVTIEIPSGVRVSGRIVDKATRKPLNTFSAGVSQSRSGGGMVMMGPPQLKPFTSDDGTFVLDNIPTGAVNLIAQAPGYAQARMNLTVEEGKPLSDIELELDPGTKLVGKVTGPDGQGLPGVSVRVATAVGGGTAMVFAGGGKATVTDSNGEYSIDALEPTDENIEFSHSKYVGTRKQVSVKGREVRLDVQLTSGQRVTGVVVTEGGAPVADAEIDAMAGAGTFRTARSDANGSFTFESLPTARYRFSAGKRGFAEATVEDFDISAGAPLRLVLKSGATLYGQVHGLSADELQHTTIEARGETFASAAVDSKG
ncbi:MAG TPA: carboxypeptidase regulatory-like domain-containing protein, partial [Thermoanaerobaculia bacterium]|nr:carboxypeptidase regulatory-like domain-containing protein [Thermoanaerobaculia bacterium]